MKVRVIEEQTAGLNRKNPERLVPHYIPQYCDEQNIWRTCYLDSTLVGRYYYKIEDAINVCKEYAEKNALKVVWSDELTY